MRYDPMVYFLHYFYLFKLCFKISVNMLYIIKLKVEVKFIFHIRKAVFFAEIRALNYKSVLGFDSVF